MEPISLLSDEEIEDAFSPPKQVAKAKNPTAKKETPRKQSLQLVGSKKKESPNKNPVIASSTGVSGATSSKSKPNVAGTSVSQDPMKERRKSRQDDEEEGKKAAIPKSDPAATRNKPPPFASLFADDQGEKKGRRDKVGEGNPGDPAARGGGGGGEEVGNAKKTLAKSNNEEIATTTIGGEGTVIPPPPQISQQQQQQQQQQQLRAPSPATMDTLNNLLSSWDASKAVASSMMMRTNSNTSNSGGNGGGGGGGVGAASFRSDPGVLSARKRPRLDETEGNLLRSGGSNNNNHNRRVSGGGGAMTTGQILSRHLSLASSSTSNSANKGMGGGGKNSNKLMLSSSLDSRGKVILGRGNSDSAAAATSNKNSSRGGRMNMHFDSMDVGGNNDDDDDDDGENEVIVWQQRSPRNSRRDGVSLSEDVLEALAASTRPNQSKDTAMWSEATRVAASLQSGFRVHGENPSSASTSSSSLSSGEKKSAPVLLHPKITGGGGGGGARSSPIPFHDSLSNKKRGRDDFQQEEQGGGTSAIKKTGEDEVMEDAKPEEEAAKKQQQHSSKELGLLLKNLESAAKQPAEVRARTPVGDSSRKKPAAAAAAMLASDEKRVLAFEPVGDVGKSASVKNNSSFSSGSEKNKNSAMRKIEKESSSLSSSVVSGTATSDSRLTMAVDNSSSSFVSAAAPNNNNINKQSTPALKRRTSSGGGGGGRMTDIEDTVSAAKGGKTVVISSLTQQSSSQLPVGNPPRDPPPEYLVAPALSASFQRSVVMEVSMGDASYFYSTLDAANANNPTLLRRHSSATSNDRIPCIDLRVIQEQSGQELTVKLVGDWMNNTNINPGDVINIIGTPDAANGVILVDEFQNLIITHPDVLVSGSRVAANFACTRRVVLDERTRDLQQNSEKIPLLGTLAHRLFQRGLNGRTDARGWELKLQNVVAESVAELYAADVSEEEATQYLKGILPQAREWVRNYCGTEPRVAINRPIRPASKIGGADSNVLVKRNSSGAQFQQQQQQSKRKPEKICVTSVYEIEQSIWSPRYGLKGMLDACVEITVKPEDSAAGGAENDDLLPRNLRGPNKPSNFGRQTPPPPTPAGPPKTAAAAAGLHLLGDSGTSSSIISNGTRNSLECVKDDSDPQQQQQQQQQDNNNNGTYSCTVPLELKSGKDHGSIGHRAQVVAYSLLLGEYLGHDVDSGLLVYMMPSATLGVPREWLDVRGIIQSRNRIATDLSAINRLPAVKRDARACGNCPQKVACMLLHKTVENGDSNSSGVAQIFDEATSGLLPSHAEFLAKWMHLLGLEEQNPNGSSRRELWTQSPIQRAKKGHCLPFLTLTKCIPAADGNHYYFSQPPRRKTKRRERAEQLSQTKNNNNNNIVNKLAEEDGDDKKKNNKGDDDDEDDEVMDDFDEGEETWMSIDADSIFSVGDSVVVSAHPNHVAVASGSIREVSHDQVVVGISSSLRDPVTGVMLKWDLPLSSPAWQSMWILDSDSLGSFFPRARSNLLALFGPNGDSRRRGLIVDLNPPEFQMLGPEEQELLNACEDGAFSTYRPKEEGKRETASTASSSSFGEFSNLNKDQRHAVKRVLEARDYALILGMPGTGKTTTVAQIIAALVRRGKSVLLSSFTHAAVDTMLLKLKEFNIPFVRLGKCSQVHADLHTSTVERSNCRTVTAVAALIEQAPVVGTTCLGINHSLLSRRRFDYCIVDEASQIHQLLCLGPLSLADTFVLVGDHYQLPPLIASAEALEQGAGESLFRRLCEANPQAVIELQLQYRMNADVNFLANELVYNGRLRCATSSVAAKQLIVPKRGGIYARSHNWETEGIAGVEWAIKNNSNSVAAADSPPKRDPSLPVLAPTTPGNIFSGSATTTPSRLTISTLGTTLTVVDTPAGKGAGAAAAAASESTSVTTTVAITTAGGGAAAAGGNGATTMTPPAWVVDCLRPERRVVYLSTDLVKECQESTIRNNLHVNHGEVSVISALVRYLCLGGGISPSAIGIICPFRAQVVLMRAAMAGLSEKLRKEKKGDFDDETLDEVEVSTVDRFQGRDKECIILSLVRANKEKVVGVLLRDWRRINVAITRAEKKLIIVGSPSTLSVVPLFDHLDKLCQEKQWVVPVTDVPILAPCEESD